MSTTAPEKARIEAIEKRMAEYDDAVKNRRIDAKNAYRFAAAWDDVAFLLAQLTACRKERDDFSAHRDALRDKLTACRFITKEQTHDTND